jgi:uncharacterized membrane protein
MKTITNAFKLISVWMLTLLFVFIGFAILTFIISNLSGVSCIETLQIGVTPFVLIGVIIASIVTYYYAVELELKIQWLSLEH